MRRLGAEEERRSLCGEMLALESPFFLSRWQDHKSRPPFWLGATLCLSPFMGNVNGRDAGAPLGSLALAPPGTLRHSPSPSG